MYLAHLLVQMILLVFYEVDVFGSLSEYFSEYFGAIFAVFFPFGEFRGSETVSQGAERGVWFKPMAVFLYEGLEIGTIYSFLAFLGENFVSVRCFDLVHALVVYGWEAVKLVGLVSVVFHPFFVRQDAEFAQTDVHRVEGKGAVGVVWVRVGPRVCHGGVVYRQELNKILTGGNGPVYESDDIHEVAYAAIVLGTKREYRYSRACAFPQIEHVYEAHAGYYGGVAGLRRNFHTAVFATFPRHHFASLFL